MNDAQRTRPLHRLPWKQLFAQGLLIVVSVYVAILLEGISQDRRDARDARTALAQMLGEMRQDRADLAEIRAEQLERDRQYDDLDRWLADPGSIPPDSLTTTLTTVGSSNRTLYPRRSAWTTMVAAGQLRDLGDPQLITRLGNFYESVNVRVIDNGDDYDASLNDVFRNSIAQIWDPATGSLTPTGARGLTGFRNQLRWLHTAWNRFYLDLLDGYEQQLDTLIGEIEAYLGEHGAGS